MGFTDHKLKFTIDADGKGAKRELSEVDRLIGKIGKSGSGMGDVFGGNLASQAVSKLSQALVSGGQTILDYSARMEQSKIGFTTLMGSAQAATQHLKDLQKFALSTPFEFQDLTTASRRLQNVGLEAKKVIPVMEDIGNAAAAAGASSAELDSISLAFSQIIAKGKLSAEEVNQLAERGIPVWKMLEEQLGKSKGEIIKLAEQGKISSEVFLDAFQRFSQANFGGAMKAQSKTFLGAMSTIKDAALQAADEGLKPLYNELVRYANRMAQNEGEVQTWGQTTNKVLQNIIDGLHGANNVAAEPDGLWAWMKWGLDNFDYHLRNTDAMGRAYTRWAESMREAGAQMRNLEEGMLNLENFTYWPGGGGPTGAVGSPAVFGTGTWGHGRRKRPPLAIPDGGAGTKKNTADKLPAFGSMQSLVISSGNPKWDAWFNQMGQRFNVDPNVLLLQAGAESSFKSGATSPKGAKGFSQFMPGTAARFGVDTSSVKDSIRGQAQYMGLLLSMFGGDYSKALAGYNAGEGAVQKYGGIPPFRETRGYVSKIQSSYRSRVKKGGGAGYGTYDFTDDAEDLDAIGAGLRELAADWIADERQASSERLDIRRLEADQAIEIIEGMVLTGELTEKESIDRVGRLRLDMLEDERAELQAQIPTAENQKRLEELRLEIETERLKQVNARLRTEKQISDEIDRQIDGLRKANQRPTGTLGHRETDEERSARMMHTTVGSGSEISALGQLNSYFVSEGNTAAIAGVDALAQAFGGLGQAIGATVEAWVLYGAAGASAQEVTAKILASVAQQAAVKAIFELAEGFAALAMSYFGIPNAGPSAAAHFTAAAIYGSIAGIAAVAGRTVAGDSMNKSAGSSSSSSSSSAQQQRSNEPYSRVTDDAYVSGQRNTVFENLTAEIRQLRKMVQTASPGDVLVRGSQQRKGFIGTQAVDDMKTRPQLGTRMLRQANAR